MKRNCNIIESDHLILTSHFAKGGLRGICLTRFLFMKLNNKQPRPLAAGLFIHTWNIAQTGAVNEPENHLVFESITGMLSILTPKRLELLRCLRKRGPMSVRALSKTLKRDYKNVHTEAKALEVVDLIQRTDNNLLIAPWDVIDAHVSLVA